MNYQVHLLSLLVLNILAVFLVFLLLHILAHLDQFPLKEEFNILGVRNVKIR